MRRVGVISDTHGLADPALPRLFRGVDQILHGGDIVGEHVLEALGAIAQVTAIVGNCDGPPLTDTLPPWRVHDVEGERVLILHDLGKPERPTRDARALLERERPTIVISGHSHKGHVEVRDGVLFLNPGSAGRKRFKLQRSAALLVFTARQVEARLLSLEDGPGEVIASARKPREAPVSRP